MRTFRSPDSTHWQVIVQLPSHSSAMLMFRHPDGQTSRLDRYAWINSAKVTDPRERLTSESVLDALSDDDIARHFRRSMMVSANRAFVSRTA
jgi:hypothetical protein